MLTWQGAGDRCRNERAGEVDAGCVCSLTVVTGLWYVSGGVWENLCVSQTEYLLALLTGFPQVCVCVCA